jgi:cytidylate kinase
MKYYKVTEATSYEEMEKRVAKAMEEYEKRVKVDSLSLKIMDIVMAGSIFTQDGQDDILDKIRELLEKEL